MRDVVGPARWIMAEGVMANARQQPKALCNRGGTGAIECDYRVTAKATVRLKANSSPRCSGGARQQSRRARLRSSGARLLPPKVISRSATMAQPSNGIQGHRTSMPECGPYAFFPKRRTGAGMIRPHQRRTGHTKVRFRPKAIADWEKQAYRDCKGIFK